MGDGFISGVIHRVVHQTSLAQLFYITQNARMQQIMEIVKQNAKFEKTSIATESAIELARIGIQSKTAKYISAIKIYLEDFGVDPAVEEGIIFNYFISTGIGEDIDYISKYPGFGNCCAQLNRDKVWKTDDTMEDM